MLERRPLATEGEPREHLAVLAILHLAVLEHHDGLEYTDVLEHPRPLKKHPVVLEREHLAVQE